MTKLRMNHSRRSRGGTSFLIRISIFTVLLFLALAAIGYVWNKEDFQSALSSSATEKSAYQDGDNRYYLPSGHDDLEIVHHRYYSLGYNERYEIPSWVAYTLSKQDLQVKNVPRTNRYNPDYAVSTGSAFHRDYTGSGYSRGHMAPAGDMAHNETAMKESFYMSNIVPQPRASNNGIWKELEENVRDWAYDNDVIVVVTGPVISSVRQRIGKNKVGVPEMLYKVILDAEGSDQKAIGFLVPNKRSEKHLSEYATSVDDIEKLTGLNFFADLLDENLQSQLESQYDLRDWPINENRYQLRIKKWNDQ